MNLLKASLVFFALGCVKGNKNLDAMADHDARVGSSISDFVGQSSCRQQYVSAYVRMCKKNDAHVYMFFDNSLVMCNKRPYTMGALTSRAPGDPLVREKLKIVKLCDGASPLYFNPSNSHS